MRATGFLLFAASRKAVGELAAVVGQQSDDLDRAGLLSLSEKIDTIAVELVGIDLDEEPTRGAVDGDEHIAPCLLIGHLWKAPDIDVHEAWFVVLEGRFHGRRCLLVRLGHASPRPHDGASNVPVRRARWSN